MSICIVFYLSNDVRYSSFLYVLKKLPCSFQKKNISLIFKTLNIMKKLAILLLFVFATATINSCKSTKGCGLTGSLEMQKTEVSHLG